MKDDDLISIIVPIYNGEKYLEQCLKSIIEQTYSNIEILLINDGSTDNSIKICNRYVDLDQRIKLINKKNTGVSDSRNIGILNARGNYICFIDCDDYIDETMIEEMYKYITIINADILRCKMKLVNKFSRIDIENLYELNDKKINNENIKKILYHFITSYDNIGCYVMPLMIRKDKIVQFNKELTFMEDTEFYVRLFLNANSIFFLDKALYYYRYNESSVSKNVENSMKNILGAINSICYIKNTLDKEKILTDTFEKDINNHFLNVMFTRLKLYVGISLLQQTKFLKNIFSNKDIQNILNNLHKEKLTIIKKIELALIKLKLYLLLAIVIKLTNVKIFKIKGDK